MASVFNSAAPKYRYKPDDYQAGISESIQTVREKIMQQCINRFYSAPGQLETYQDQRRKFVASGSSKEVSALEAFSGLVDHDSFKTLVQKSEIQRVLQESGLTKSEIEVLLKETSETIPASSVRLPEDVADRNQLTTLQAVLKKLSERETVLSTQNSEQHENFAGAVELSRIEYEDALRDGALSSNPSEALSCVATSALVKRKTHRQPAVHPQHPLNHLAALEQEFFAGRDNIDEEQGSSGNAYIQQGSKRRQVRVNEFCDGIYSKSISSELEAGGSELKKVKLVDEQSCKVDLASYSESRSVGSLWDVKDIPSNSIKDTSIDIANRKVVSKKCSVGVVQIPVHDSLLARNRKKKDFSKGFISLPNPVDLVPLPHISDNCIPLSQLLVEFPNYHSGNPSRTLYLKNLSNQTAPEDLVNIFGHFDYGRDHAMYRLLRGRMRGQAFVEFPTVDIAQKAFKACLGYMMRGKPLVIEFGKEK